MGLSAVVDRKRRAEVPWELRAREGRQVLGEWGEEMQFLIFRTASG
jgi:hypothetical protein